MQYPGRLTRPLLLSFRYAYEGARGDLRPNNYAAEGLSYFTANASTGWRLDVLRNSSVALQIT